MISVLFPYTETHAGQLVLAALRRSVSRTQATALSIGALDWAQIIVAVNIPDDWGDTIRHWLGDGSRKLILLGRVPPKLAIQFGWRSTEWPEGLQQAARSEPAPAHRWSASSAVVRYHANASVLGADDWERHFERFDFTAEWNNLGFGAIRTDGSCWSVAQPLNTGEDELAYIDIGDRPQGSYAALAALAGGSILWFNRAVGPCDSFEWRLVENFISEHRAADLPCQPVLREIPWGYDAAVTSRLDCDEDVESARALWQAYRELGVPFSLAVHTSNLGDCRHHSILKEVLANAGAVLSHTATHAPNWGGSYEAALQEGHDSARLLQQVTGKPVSYAVSPFHQTPHYALQALADVGYSGCIGGIIRNDPEFLLARGGNLTGTPAGFIGHSQQCMLHGDCQLTDGDPLAVYKQAFDHAYETCTLFGYLDHPFSGRYSYGWADEQTRIQAHRELIHHIRQKADNPLFLNEDQALDFLSYRSRCQLLEHDGAYFASTPNSAIDLKVALEYKGAVVSLEPGVVLQ